jgi:Anti-sigma-K factor rskA/Putative zinc-finger
MTSRDHMDYRDEIGAYLLGALTDLERQAFERHLDGCAECRDEVEQLRPAADSLPRSVEQLEPPPGLKSSLMEVVEREARERSSGPARARRPLGERLRALVAPMRPVLVAGVLAVGLLVGFGVSQLVGGGDDTRTVAASVDQSRIPDGSARLQIEGDGADGGTLSVRGMPSPGRGKVYQAWVQRDGEVTPEPTFEVGRDGGGAVAVPDDLSGAQAVLVTREPRGGSRAPSERPVVIVRL